MIDEDRWDTSKEIHGEGNAGSLSTVTSDGVRLNSVERLPEIRACDAGVGKCCVYGGGRADGGGSNLARGRHEIAWGELRRRENGWGAEKVVSGFAVQSDPLI